VIFRRIFLGISWGKNFGKNFWKKFSPTFFRGVDFRGILPEMLPGKNVQKISP
jgi:hypothetical protein